jgi:hypothetical protein
MPVLHFATEIVRLIWSGRFALERELKGGEPGDRMAARLPVRSPRSGGGATGGTMPRVYRVPRPARDRRGWNLTSAHGPWRAPQDMGRVLPAAPKRLCVPGLV